MLRPSPASFLPARLKHYVDAEDPVRIIDAFVVELDLAKLGFERSNRQPLAAPDTR